MGVGVLIASGGETCGAGERTGKERGAEKSGSEKAGGVKSFR